MAWNRGAGVVLMVVSLLLSLPGCGDPCDTVEIDTTLPSLRKVLRPADAIVEASVISISRITDDRISVELEVLDVLVDGPPDHPLAPGPLTVIDSAIECAPSSGFLVAGDQPVLVALSWHGDTGDWSAWAVLRVQIDGSVEFLDYGGRLNDLLDEILREPTAAGVIAEVERP